MIRCYLRGSMGDALHAIALGYPVSCAADYNIRWLMRAIMRLPWPFCAWVFSVSANRYAAIRPTKCVHGKEYAINLVNSSALRADLNFAATTCYGGRRNQAAIGCAGMNVSSGRTNVVFIPGI